MPIRDIRVPKRGGGGAPLAPALATPLWVKQTQKTASFLNLPTRLVLKTVYRRDAAARFFYIYIYK